MTIAERERYVRWWIEESGLTRRELRRVAATVWGGREPERLGTHLDPGRSHSRRLERR
jgi:hypothetical protein